MELLSELLELLESLDLLVDCSVSSYESLNLSLVSLEGYLCINNSKSGSSIVSSLLYSSLDVSLSSLASESCLDLGNLSLINSLESLYLLLSLCDSVSLCCSGSSLCSLSLSKSVVASLLCSGSGSLCLVCSALS